MRRAMAFLGLVLAIVSAASGAKVTFLGHACVAIESADGTVILVDPYPASIRLPGLPVAADVVLVTHQQHFDHCAVDRVLGDPVVVWGLEADGSVAAGDQVVGGIRIRRVASDHGSFRGGSQGRNAVFVFTVDGVRFAHLGGVGVPLGAAELSAIGEVDVVFMTAGGVYSLPPAKMIDLLQGLPRTPSVVIPIHAQAPEVNFPLLPLSSFLSVSPWPAVALGASAVEVSPTALPSAPEVWILDAKR